MGAERTKDATSHRSNKISYRGICLKFSLHYSEITARHVAAGGSFANFIGSAPTLHGLWVVVCIAFYGFSTANDCSKGNTTQEHYTPNANQTM